MAKKDRQQYDDLSLTLRLSGVEADETSPVLRIRALSAAGKVLEETKAEQGGSFRISAKALDGARIIELSAADSEAGEVVKMTPAQLALAARDGGQLVLSPARWRPLLPWGICVDGKVRMCWYWPWYVQTVNTAVQFAPSRLGLATARVALDPSLSVFRPVPCPRCRPICQGMVEVYERVCCCHPVFTPPDLGILLERLRDKLRPIPKPKWPKIPRPQPDPVPFSRTGIFTGSTLVATDLQAEADTTRWSKPILRRRRPMSQPVPTC